MSIRPHTPPRQGTNCCTLHYRRSVASRTETKCILGKDSSVAHMNRRIASDSAVAWFQDDLGRKTKEMGPPLPIHLRYKSGWRMTLLLSSSHAAHKLLLMPLHKLSPVGLWGHLGVTNQHNARTSSICSRYERHPFHMSHGLTPRRRPIIHIH